jgi:hypothetical protein
MNWLAYLRTYLLVLVALLALVGVLNVAVDPYGIFGVPQVDGFNLVKPAAPTRSRISKPSQGHRVQPATLIMGNSRPEMGLDPEDPNWRLEHQPVYNQGLPGSSVYMMLRNAQDLVSGGSVQLVFWGLDFTDFVFRTEGSEDACQWPPQRQDWESRLRVRYDMSPARGWRLERAKDAAIAALSADALRDSLITVMSQKRRGAANLTDRGFNPAADYLPIVRAEGQQILFMQKNAEMQERLEGAGWRIVDGACDSSESFRSVDELLQVARAMGVRVVLFVNPYHDDYQRVIWQAQLWPLFAEWKRLLAQRYAGVPGVEVWDFSLLNGYTTEPPPPAGDRSSMLRWFWEPAHYRAELGTLMLSQMLHGEVPEQGPVGVRLTPQMIEEHLLAQFRQAHERWGTNVTEPGR